MKIIFSDRNEHFSNIEKTTNINVILFEFNINSKEDYIDKLLKIDLNTIYPKNNNNNTNYKLYIIIIIVLLIISFIFIKILINK